MLLYHIVWKIFDCVRMRLKNQHHHLLQNLFTHIMFSFLFLSPSIRLLCWLPSSAGSFVKSKTHLAFCFHYRRWAACGGSYRHGAEWQPGGMLHQRTSLFCEYHSLGQSNKSYNCPQNVPGVYLSKVYVWINTGVTVVPFESATKVTTCVKLWPITGRVKSS